MFTRHRRTVLATLVALIAVVGLASCSDSDDGDDLVGVRQLETDTTVGNEDADEDSEAERTSVALVPFAEVPAPTALTPHPDTGQLYVAERTGRVHEVDRETGAVTAEPVLDIADEVSADGERGLLGLAFSESGDELYVHYSDLDGDTVVEAWDFDDGTADAASRRELFALAQPFGNHNGGELQTGPDGYLYLALGDGGGAGDPNSNAQNTDVHLGSILRVDPTSGDPYEVPDDNPFTGGDAPEIWLYGVRNPWRFSFDQATGDLWIGDVGQNAIEEIDYLPAEDDGAGRGANLGWNVMEGTQTFSPGGLPDDAVGPVHEFDNGNGNCSVTGGYVYRGSTIPWLDGAYVFSDFCAGDLRFLRPAGAEVVESEALGVGLGTNTLASFGQDLMGEIYALSLADGAIFRLDPA